jgi:hypothetical protein
MGAIRSLRFSADGRFLAAAEPADFVHVYDAAKGFAEVGRRMQMCARIHGWTVEYIVRLS